jgi:hypothetical protein
VRRVYQSSQGGACYIPLEKRTGIIGSTTPRMAQILSWKYAHLSGDQVVEDFSENHNHVISKTLVQNTVARVGTFLADNEANWSYELPDMSAQVSHISISRDGTTSPVLPCGYKETMVGTISFYEHNGQRMHTIYVGVAPQSGKENFDAILEGEICKVKALYPKAIYTAVADGAKSNWTYLTQYASVCVLDYFHASEYLASVSALFPKEWLSNACSRLKTEKYGARKLLKQLKRQRKAYAKDKVPEALSKTITYFTNNLSRMNYESYAAQGYPIGSGVTEAACKTLVKQRLSRSGMRWSITSIDDVLIIRGLVLTNGRWRQTWNLYDKNLPKVTSW